MKFVESKSYICHVSFQRFSASISFVLVHLDDLFLDLRKSWLLRTSWEVIAASFLVQPVYFLGCGSVLCLCKSEYIDEVQIDTENGFCQQVLGLFQSRNVDSVPC